MGLKEVSIRSPHRSKGRRRNIDADEPPTARHVSIRSPHRSKGTEEIELARQLEVSIRSPHRSKGRLAKDGVAGLGILVSIRSPHRSKGRRRVSELRARGPQ